MRAVIQRVREASVAVEGRVVGAIGPGLLAFIGVEAADTDEDVAWLAHKLPALRVFDDQAGRMNLSLADTGGQILLVSQFTLYGSLKKGTRPSFNRAAPPEQARGALERLHTALEAALGRPVPTGVFGAMMEIRALNDGPVTLVLDTKQKDF
ncbi:MAG TPA: D-aminoacyl-tRNA deacylase [Opitutales bacterium]|nr:D-aminoacyl-tRNA deacylase [Opitutales bacterium]